MVEQHTLSLHNQKNQNQKNKAMKKVKFTQQIVVEMFDEIGVLSSQVVAQFASVGDCYICFNALCAANQSKIIRYRIESIKKIKTIVEVI